MDAKIYQFSHLSFPKYDGFENPSQIIEWFSRNQRTHADGATSVKVCRRVTRNNVAGCSHLQHASK